MHGTRAPQDLHRYPDEVNNITVAATQEGKIERELAKVTTLWGAKNFPMYAYKGNEAMRVLNDCSELVTEVWLGTEIETAPFIFHHMQKVNNKQGPMSQTWLQIMHVHHTHTHENKIQVRSCSDLSFN